MSIRQPTLADIAKLLLLGGIWGSSFMCIEIALASFAPLTIAAGRILLAALALSFLAWMAGYRWPAGAVTWGLLIVNGLFNSALPFLLISWGQQFIPSSLTAILIATGPFVSLLLSHLFTADDRLTLPKVLGMLIGFSGVIVLVGIDAFAGASQSVLGQLAVMGAAACYSASSVLTRKLAHLPPLLSSAAVLTTAACYMVPLALFADPIWVQSPHMESVMALGFLGLISTAFAYFLRFQLILRVGVVFISQVSYLVPLFAVLWGWLFLAEVPTVSIWIALGLILMGINVSRLRVGASRKAASFEGD